MSDTEPSATTVQTGTAKLPSGVELAYIDSGPVQGSNDYTTVVLLHGSTYNAHTFERIHPLAASRNLRTIAVQRRDYPGSTPYSDEELDDIKHGRPAFMDRTAVQIAEFVQYVARDLKVPSISESGLSGGIALLGWSIGGPTALAPLSRPELLSADVKAVLEEYLRKVIIFDSPHYAYGYTLPEGLSFQVSPTEKTSPEKHYDAFKAAVIGYYNTPANWAGDISLLDRRTPAEAAYLPHAWTPEDYEKRFSLQAGVRSEFYMQSPPIQALFKENAQRVLFDQGIAKTFCPRTSIGILSVGRSHWICQYGTYHTQQLHREHLAKGEKLRPLSVSHIQHANHFAHYHYPEDFANSLKTLLS